MYAGEGLFVGVGKCGERFMMGAVFLWKWTIFWGSVIYVGNGRREICIGGFRFFRVKILLGWECLFQREVEEFCLMNICSVNCFHGV